MNLKLKYKLWTQKTSLSPEKQFKTQLWKKLDQQWNSQYGKTIWFQLPNIQRAFALGLVLIVVLGLGTASYAYSSPQVVQGSPLYFVKQNLENIEEKLQIKPEQKARFYLKKIERREEEKKILNIKGKKVEKIEAEIEKAEEKLEKADEILEKSPVKDKELVEKIKNRLQKRQLKRIEHLENRISDLNALLQSVPTGTVRVEMDNNLED